MWLKNHRLGVFLPFPVAFVGLTKFEQYFKPFVDATFSRGLGGARTTAPAEAKPAENPARVQAARVYGLPKVQNSKGSARVIYWASESGTKRTVRYGAHKTHKNHSAQRRGYLLRRIIPNAERQQVGDYGKTIHLRLTPDQERRLRQLHGDHFAGLPLSTVLRFLVGSVLALEMETLVAVVNEQIKKPGQKTSGTKVSNRLSGLNRKSKRST